MVGQAISKYFFLTVVGVTLVVVVFVGVDGRFFQSSLENSIDSNQVLAAVPQILEISAPLETPPPALTPAPLDLQAQAAVSVNVADGQQKILFGKNEEQKLPVASLTKLMTALVVLSHYDLSQKVIINADAMAQVGEQGNLKNGQEFSVKSLLYSTLIESNNRAAYALSGIMGSGKFIAAMNEQAQKLGLINTHFADTTGLSAASYSTAKDIAAVTAYLFKTYPLFSQIISQKNANLYLYDGTFHHQMQNTNELLGQQDIIGGKTGFTDQAQGCFMAIQTAARPGDYVISVVLGAQDRFLEMQKLIKFINE